MGARHRDAPAPGPEVEDAPHPTAVDPGMKAFLDELRERRPRHQHPPVDLELQAREPRLAGEIGGGNPLLDSPAKERADRPAFTAGQAGVEELGGERRAGRKAQRVEDEGEGLVDRVVGAVREAQPGLVEPARPEANEVRDGAQPLPAKRRTLRHRSAGSWPRR